MFKFNSSCSTRTEASKILDEHYYLRNKNTCTLMAKSINKLKERHKIMREKDFLLKRH